MPPLNHHRWVYEKSTSFLHPLYQRLPVAPALIFEGEDFGKIGMLPPSECSGNDGAAINFGNNKFLDKEGFTPFARIEGDGMAVIKALHVTGEGAPSGPGPNQGAIQQRGNAYLKKDFPEIDYITSATIVSFMA